MHLQSYAQEQGHTIDELRNAIAELLSDSDAPHYASQAADDAALRPDQFQATYRFDGGQWIEY